MDNDNQNSSIENSINTDDQIFLENPFVSTKKIIRSDEKNSSLKKQSTVIIKSNAVDDYINDRNEDSI